MPTDYRRPQPLTELKTLEDPDAQRTQRRINLQASIVTIAVLAGAAIVALAVHWWWPTSSTWTPIP